MAMIRLEEDRPLSWFRIGAYAPARQRFGGRGDGPEYSRRGGQPQRHLCAISRNRLASEFHRPSGGAVGFRAVGDPGRQLDRATFGWPEQTVVVAFRRFPGLLVEPKGAADCWAERPQGSDSNV